MQCSQCGRDTPSPRQYEWIAATQRVVASEYLGGNARVDKVLHQGQPFSIAMCDDCYWPASQRRARWWSLFWVCVLVFVATPCLSGLIASEPLARHTNGERLAFHLLRGLAALALLAGWGLALWGVPRWLRNQKNRVEEGSAIDAVSRPLAKRRMRELGCDWLYRPEEWRQLGRKPQA